MSLLCYTAYNKPLSHIHCTHKILAGYECEGGESVRVYYHQLTQVFVLVKTKQNQC